VLEDYSAQAAQGTVFRKPLHFRRSGHYFNDRTFSRGKRERAAWHPSFNACVHRRNR
jgi:hypothetical protein